MKVVKKTNKPELKKRPFRRAGEPLKVRLCKEDDEHFKTYEDFARRLKNQPYLDKEGWLCVDVLSYDMVYRTPDTAFARIDSGTYTFDSQGRPQKVA